MNTKEMREIFNHVDSTEVTIRETGLYAVYELERLQSDSRWIPVDHSKEYSGMIFPCETKVDTGGFVTHWRPLPAPPDIEEGE